MTTKTTSEGAGSNPEVPERAKRRRFTAEYKLGIVHGQTPKSAAILPSSGLAAGWRASATPSWRRLSFA